MKNKNMTGFPFEEQPKVRYDDPGISCDPREDRTRQEHKADADINNILRQVAPHMVDVHYSDVDYDLTLQKALELTRDADTAFARLPDPIRQNFHDWPAVLDGVAKGHIVVGTDGKGLTLKPPVVPPVVP